MKKKTQPRKNNRSNVRRENEPLPWRFALVTLVCGVALVGGFFYAAKTHFAAIQYCIGNAELKKQISELEAEKRRLSLAKEVALAPAEIKKAARRLGLVDMTAFNLATADAPESLSTLPATDAGKSLVRKTVDTKPVEKAKIVAGDIRDRKIERTEKSPAPGSRERLSKTGK